MSCGSDVKVSTLYQDTQTYCNICTAIPNDHHLSTPRAPRPYPSKALASRKRCVDIGFTFFWLPSFLRHTKHSFLQHTKHSFPRHTKHCPPNERPRLSIFVYLGITQPLSQIDFTTNLRQKEQKHGKYNFYFLLSSLK